MFFLIIFFFVHQNNVLKKGCAENAVLLESKCILMNLHHKGLIWFYAAICWYMWNLHHLLFCLFLLLCVMT